MKTLYLFAFLALSLLACQKPVVAPIPTALGWSKDGNYLVKDMDFKRLEGKIQTAFQNDSAESLTTSFPFLKAYAEGKSFTFMNGGRIDANKSPQIEVYKVDSLMNISDESLKKRLEQLGVLPTSGEMAAQQSNWSGRFLGFAYSEQGDYLGFCMTRSTELIDIPMQKPLDFFNYSCDTQSQSNQNPIMPSNLATEKNVWRPLWSNKNPTIQRVSVQTFSPKQVFYIADLDIGPFVWLYTSDQKTKFFSPKTQKSYIWVDQNTPNVQNFVARQVSKTSLALENSPGFLIDDK
jgi:hypothetical protein